MKQPKKNLPLPSLTVDQAQQIVAYLKANYAGELFYCWVKPSTVHKLWHEWTHPVLDAKSSKEDR